MKKSDVNPMPEHFDRYIKLVSDVELSKPFEDSIRQLDELDTNLFKKISGEKSSPDKWTAKETATKSN